MYSILVIDDDPAMTDLLKILLTTNDMEVKVVNDGQSGIDCLNDFSPNIVVLDLMMPDLDGWKVCQKIKQMRQIPILILSALDSPRMIADALDAGADDYLIKPVTSSSLIAHINNLVRRSKTANLIVRT
ncbi:MAG: response regulator [Anaerolineaceae bacterium]|nr:response regulator [Anaerolineaceae bacterium]